MYPGEGSLMIQFSCPSCSKTYSVPDEREGKRTKCKKCRSSIVIRKTKAQWFDDGLVDDEPNDDEPSFAHTAGVVAASVVGIVITVILGIIVYVSLGPSLGDIAGKAMWLIPSLAVSACVGYAIGLAKGRPGPGAALGFFLGPLGWLVAIAMNDGLVKCPYCKEKVKPDAVKCRHCQSKLG